MKRIAVFLLGCGSLLLLLQAGCASSERMMRTSGGVFQDYSAPQKSRITSGKFAAVPHPAHSKRDQRQELGGIHDTLINIWPFFFRNRDYISCLWPMIDADPYGFAVRPFYNQEGDDYSILFPLIAWNPAKRHGWIFNTYWNNEVKGYGFFPLFHHSPGFGMYTPFWIRHHKENRKHDPYKSPFISSDFHLISLLGYGKTEINWNDPGPYALHRLLSPSQITPDSTLAYKLAAYGIKTPLPKKEDKAGWDKIRQQAAEKFVQQKTVSGGVFPLFGFKTAPDQNEFNILLGFPYYESSDYKTRFSILSDFLFGYTRKNSLQYGTPTVHGFAGETSVLAWALLCGFETDRRYAENPKTRAFERINKMRYSALNRQKIQQELQIIDPEAKLPDTVVDHATLELFLRELQRKTELPTESYTTGGFLPLYFQHSTRGNTFRIMPALLTWSESNQHRSEFVSLPLLSWGKKSKGYDTTAIFWPFGYYRKNIEFNRDSADIFAADSNPEYELLTQDKTYAACGLFRREIKTFYTAKPGYNAKELNQLLQETRKFAKDQKRLHDRKKNLQTRRKKADAMPRKTKIEEYTYLIELERIRIEEENIGKEQAKLLKRAGEITRKAADNHVTLDMADPKKAEKTLFAACTPLTRTEYGSSLIFNRVNVSNGAFRWQTMLKLASGEGNADREDTQVLQFLYRHKRRGEKTETIYFPFVAIQKDGENSRFRFLWRVFERTVEKGKVKGHILFIPYGE